MMRLVIIAVLASFASLGAQTPVDGVVTWREEERAIESLATEQDLGPEPIAAAKTWATWAAEREYRLVLTDDGRVLLVFSKTYARRQGGRREDSTMLRFLRSVEKAIAEVDRLIPPALTPDAPSKTVVVVGVRQEHYTDILEAVTTQHEPLRDWASKAALLRSGFVLGEPLVAVWIEDPPRMEEWNRENEVVHRAAAELLARYAQHLPKWLQVALAWHVEERVMDSIYCLPYRSGFVSAYDHTDWDRNLMQKFKRRRRTPLELQEVAEWNPRESYDMDKAQIAFGISRYLADHAPESLPPLLRELDQQISEKRKVPTGEYTWITDTNYRLPISEQLALFEKHAGETFLTEVTRFFIEGKTYRPGRKRR